MLGGWSDVGVEVASFNLEGRRLQGFPKLSLSVWWVVRIEYGNAARLFSEVPCERREAVGTNCSRKIGCKGNNSAQQV